MRGTGERHDGQCRKVRLGARGQHGALRFVAIGRGEIQTSVRIARPYHFRIGDGEGAGDIEMTRRAKEAVSDGAGSGKYCVVIGQTLDGFENRDRIVSFHHQHIVVRTALGWPSVLQGAERPPETLLVDRDNDVPVFHAQPRKASIWIGSQRCSSPRPLVQNIRQVNDASAVKIPWCGARKTRTGMVLCVSTLTVSLPSTIAEIPRRPCEAMTIRSHNLRAAVSMMARYG